MSEPYDQGQSPGQEHTGWLGMTLEMLKDVSEVIHASVIQVRGSAPRAVGANMLITADNIWDTIGGGAL